MKLIIGLVLAASAAIAGEITDPAQMITRQAGHFSLPTFEASARNCTGEVYPECIDRSVQAALTVGQWTVKTHGVVCGEDYPQCLEKNHAVVPFNTVAYHAALAQCGETYPECQERAVGQGIGSSRSARGAWKAIRDFFRGARGGHHDECPGCYVGNQ